MADPNRQETGGTLMVLGWLMLLFSLAWIFFHPAANAIGRAAIDIVAIALVVGGIVFNLVGYRIRRRTT
jgi:hypothetical protein